MFMRPILYQLVTMFLLSAIASCSWVDDPPSNLDMEERLKKNLVDFEYLEHFMRENSLTRLTRNSAYPNSNLGNNDFAAARELMDKLGIMQGIQLHEEDYFEVVYWSVGILSRGESKLYLKSETPIQDIRYLQEQIKQEVLVCDAVKSVNFWYVCHR